MKKILFFIVAIALITISPTLFAIDLSSQQEIEREREYLQQFYPCSENSDNEKNVYKYVKKELDAISVSWTEQKLDTLRGSHSFTSNIIVDFKGKEDSLLILAVPFNNLEDNSLNISIALQLCRYFALSDTTPEKNIKIIFLGSEFHEDQNQQIGTNFFLQDFFPESEAYLLYLNLKSENTVEIKNITAAGATPMGLVKLAVEKFKDNNINLFIDSRENFIFRAGFNLKSYTDLYVENNIPSLYITTSDKAEKLFDIAEHETNFRDKKDSNISFPYRIVLSIIDMSTETAPISQEKNYIIVLLRNSYLFLGEKLCAIIYLAFILIFILYAVLNSKKLSGYFKRIIKHIVVIPFMLFLCFIFLFFATLIIESILLLKGTTDIWIETPLTVFSIKILIALLLFFSFLFLIKKIKLPQVGSFYSACAIFLMALNVLLFLFINLTLSLYAIWALFWIILFSFTKNRLLRILFIIISYFLIYDIIRYIFILPAFNLCNILIMGKITGNLLIAAIILPLIMMIMRILFVQAHIQTEKYKLLRIIIFDAILVITLIIVLIYYKTDFYKNKKQPISTTVFIDDDTKTSLFHVSSPAKMQEINAELQGSNYTFNSMTTEETATGSFIKPEAITITKQVSYFLDRKNIILKIKPQGNPEKIEISFLTQDNRIILDSNYPFILNTNLEGGNFHIGYNPAYPLTLDVLVEKETAIWFTVKAIYSVPPFSIELTGKNMDFNNKAIIKKSIYG